MTPWTHRVTRQRILSRSSLPRSPGPSRGEGQGELRGL
ncbi:hypothetical protein TSC_c12300 [Thermus scotoductus SA-01]|uniref:Uncharacterized protein n=1 Tax=Thermus scotoductus (strain ATCC 700910 / SA-01) TaxID=743525 RepID=E8PQR8_THESS|nr:hypothetical protein TSC_c12300 [Thermus scotoductus SA-01]